MNETVLYDYWRSSAAYRLRIAMNLAGLPYRSVAVDLLKGEHKSAEYLSRNPQGLVPVLEIDGHSMTQSLAILEYLNETRDMGLLSSDLLTLQKNVQLPMQLPWISILCVMYLLQPMRCNNPGARKPVQIGCGGLSRPD